MLLCSCMVQKWTRHPKRAVRLQKKGAEDGEKHFCSNVRSLYLGSTVGLAKAEQDVLEIRALGEEDAAIRAAMHLDAPR